MLSQRDSTDFIAFRRLRNECPKFVSRSFPIVKSVKPHTEINIFNTRSIYIMTETALAIDHVR